ncbi:MAG: hypothetical protein LCH46_04380 [Proteobacteria bacterium]|nr:hypothetical protein [Pseudomonadota bacterium]
MKCILKAEPRLSECRIRLESNSYSDSMPLVREIILRRQQPKTNTHAFGLACAALIADYCGDFLEIPHLMLGCDQVEAIRVLCNRPVNVAPFNGEIRALATHDLELVAGEAGKLNGPTEVKASGAGVPVARVDWFGDFVDAHSRSSANSQIGMYYTNAHLVTEPDFVSVAVALLHGGDNVGRIVVPVAGTITEKHQRFVAALRIVAIDLEWLEMPSSRASKAPASKSRQRAA